MPLRAYSTLNRHKVPHLENTYLALRQSLSYGHHAMSRNTIHVRPLLCIYISHTHTHTHTTYPVAYTLDSTLPPATTPSHRGGRSTLYSNVLRQRRIGHLFPWA
jgi:hypothetical protein